jgi:tetratricopeptide (TPR) repeat protein
VQSTVRSKLRTERNNLLTALRLAVETGQADIAVRLGAALSFFWTLQGSHAEAAGWLRLALDVPGEPPPQAWTVATAFYLFNAVLSAGHVSAGLALEETRTRLDAMEEAQRHPFSALIEAVLALLNHDTAAGLAAIDREASHPEPWVRGMLWLLRAFLHGNSGDTDGARDALTSAVAMFREAGERWGLAMSLTAQAEAWAALDDFDRAMDALEEAIRLLRELDPADDAIIQRASLARVRIQKGDVERGRAELLEMVRPGTGTSSGRSLVLARIALGDLARNEGDLDEAERQYQAAGTDLERVRFSAPLYRAMLWAAQAHLAVARRDPTAAGRYLAQALALAVDTPDMPIAALVCVGVARLLHCQGNDSHLFPQLSAHLLAATPGRLPSAGTLREEHELSSGPVRCIADFLDGVPVRHQRRLDLVTVAEAQRRVRGQDLPVRSEHNGRPETHQRPAHVGHLNPTLDLAHALDLGDGLRSGPVPRLPRAIRRIASLEYDVSTGPQRGIYPVQRPVPVRRIDDRLGDVRGHRRQIDLDRRQRRRVCVDPAHTLRPGLGPRHIERSAGRIEADHLQAALGEKQRERPRPTANVQDTGRAELICDVDIHVKVAAVRIECVVDRDQPRVLEDVIRHAADPSPIAAPAHSPPNRTPPNPRAPACALRKAGERSNARSRPLTARCRWDHRR